VPSDILSDTRNSTNEEEHDPDIEDTGSLKTLPEIPSTSSVQQTNGITSKEPGEEIIINGKPDSNRLISDSSKNESISASQPKRTVDLPGKDSGQRGVSSRFSVKSVSENASSKYEGRQSNNANYFKNVVSNEEASKMSHSSVLLSEITEEVSFA